MGWHNCNLDKIFCLYYNMDSIDEVADALQYGNDLTLAVAA